MGRIHWMILQLIMNPQIKSTRGTNLYVALFEKMLKPPSPLLDYSMPKSAEISYKA